MKNQKANSKIKSLEIDLKELTKELEKASQDNTNLPETFLLELASKLEDLRYDIKYVIKILEEEE